MLGAVEWGFILFVIGFILVGIEMILPGLNGPGIAGGISLITAIFLTAKSFKDGVIVDFNAYAYYYCKSCVKGKFKVSNCIKG